MICYEAIDTEDGQKTHFYVNDDESEMIVMSTILSCEPDPEYKMRLYWDSYFSEDVDYSRMQDRVVLWSSNDNDI